MISLGYCKPDSDNLNTTGLAVGRTTWTPDGSGGGALAVTIPTGIECGGEDLGTELWHVTLELVRGICGKTMNIAVTGAQNKHDSTHSAAVVTNNNDMSTPMILSGPTEVEDCAVGDWVLVSGANPLDLHVVCGGLDVTIELYGVNDTIETNATVTVTLT